ncbi:MAG: hypothetical protein SAK42_22705 [Oscillatoria sp. PMC 1076.18]|nr:hypothetical protein [Oscillatoria sp. PMC 1076.18]
MVSTLEKTKRSAIAEKLADMRAIQNLLITFVEALSATSPHLFWISGSEFNYFF